MYPLDDFGVTEVLNAADRCAGACLNHVGEPCIRWTETPVRLVQRRVDLTFLDDEGGQQLVAEEAGDE